VITQQGVAVADLAKGDINWKTPLFILPIEGKTVGATMQRIPDNLVVVTQIKGIAVESIVALQGQSGQ
jgi:hypothetical protein